LRYFDRPNLTVIATKRSNRSIIGFMNEAKFPLGHYLGGRMEYSGGVDRAAVVRAAGSDDKGVGSNGQKKRIHTTAFQNRSATESQPLTP
jgi:hypothetical protein